MTNLSYRSPVRNPRNIRQFGRESGIEEIRFLIEVKAIGIELKDAHVKQAIDYAANEGIESVVLTNGAQWRVYKVHFGQPIEKILVCELDAIGTSARSPDVLACFGNLSREGFSKGSVAEFLLQKQVTNKFTVAAVLQTDFILEVLRREIRRMSSGVKVEVDYLRSLLREEVLKRDLVDGDEAKAALQNIKRLQRADEPGRRGLRDQTGGRRSDRGASRGCFSFPPSGGSCLLARVAIMIKAIAGICATKARISLRSSGLRVLTDSVESH